MAKIANTADWQVRGNYLEPFREQAAAMVMECVRQSVQGVVVAGDIFERANIGDQHASTGAVEREARWPIAELTKHGIEVLILKGNHDQSGAGSTDALVAFEHMRGVTIVREPQHLYFCGLSVVCLPWSWAGGNPEQTVKDILADLSDPADLFVFHADAEGMLMNAKRTQDRKPCEMKPGSWTLSRGFLDALPVKKVVGGHYHKRQPHFNGALLQNNHGEEGNPAGFEIWDTCADSTEWVELTAAPIYETITIDRAELVPQSIMPDSKIITRIVYDGFTPDPIDVKHMESIGFTVDQVIDRQERTRRAEVPDGVVDSPHALIGLWCDVQNPPISDMRRGRLIRTFERLFADKATVQSFAKPDEQLVTSEVPF